MNASVIPKPSFDLPRPLHLGAAGMDAVATKRAMSRAGFMEWGTFTDVWGEHAVEACKGFQKAHKLKVDGVYGATTHKALLGAKNKQRPTEWAFDAYSIYLERKEIAVLSVTPEERVRRGIVAAAMYWYSQRYAIAYAQYRPFDLPIPPGMPHPSEWDCSAFVTACHHAGGAPNPNGDGNGPRPWDGQGYTGTLMERGRKCAIDELKPGDLAFYGFTTAPTPAFPYGAPTHVAVVVSLHPTMVVSDGHYPMGHYPLFYGMPFNQGRTYQVA